MKNAIQKKFQFYLSSCRMDKTIKPSAVFQWLYRLWKPIVGSDTRYILGPACPLKEQCTTKQETSSDLHILDMTKGVTSSCCCGNTKLDTHKLVKIWDTNVST